MQDLLKKIIEMDEQARKIERKVESEKIKSEEEVDKLREQIYNDYIARAKDRIEKNIAVDRAQAQERLNEYKAQTDEKKDTMHRLYEDNKERWVEEIVNRSLV